MENGTLTPVAPAKTGVFEETKVTVAADFNFNVDGSLPGNLAIYHPVCFSGEATYLFLLSGIFFVQGAIRLLCAMGIVFIIGHQF